MAKPPSEDTATFLARQTHQTLVAVLLELAREHEPVQARLDRLKLADQPDKLAVGFRKTLAAWKRSTRFHSYREAGEFGRTLEAWLEQVASELAPKDPPAALALFQDFIEADAVWFERADDSGGAVGDAVRLACRHWLRAAAVCETPASAWPDRLLALYLADQYGARSELLSQAHLLLDEAAQRALVDRLEVQLSEAVESAPARQPPPHEVFKLSGALSLLAASLRDPDVTVRAVLRYSPNPNPVQCQSFARDYIAADRPADALVWLQDSWGHLEDSRLSLLAEALEMLGRFRESAPIRQGMFERSLSDFYLDRWLEHLPQADRPQALQYARELALAHPDPAAAATVLLKLGEPEAAEERLLAEPGRIESGHYASLAPLAKALRNHGCRRGETAVLRALLKDVLDRANTRAYGHGARYWARLQEIANSPGGLHPLSSHEVFEAGIRAQHARKASFWAHVNGTRRD